MLGMSCVLEVGHNSSPHRVTRSPGITFKGEGRLLNPFALNFMGARTRTSKPHIFLSQPSHFYNLSQLCHNPITLLVISTR